MFNCDPNKRISIENLISEVQTLRMCQTEKLLNEGDEPPYDGEYFIKKLKRLEGTSEPSSGVRGASGMFFVNPENFKSFCIERFEPDLIEDIESFTTGDPKEIELTVGAELKKILLALKEYFSKYNERKIDFEGEDEDQLVTSDRVCNFIIMQEQENES